jgi:hypothetical protein
MTGELFGADLAEFEHEAGQGKDVKRVDRRARPEAGHWRGQTQLSMSQKLIPADPCIDKAVLT